jgi:Fe-S cluster biosynthesis and repair protein YggX
MNEEDKEVGENIFRNVSKEIELRYEEKLIKDKKMNSFNETNNLLDRLTQHKDVYQTKQAEQKENHLLKESDIPLTESIILTSINDRDNDKFTESIQLKNSPPIKQEETEVKNFESEEIFASPNLAFNPINDKKLNINKIELSPPSIDLEILKENELVKNLIQSKLNELEGYLQRDWKSVEEKSDYKIYYIEEKSGFRSIKSEVLIDKNIKIVYDFISEFENKKKFDKNFDFGNKIREIDDNYSIVYLKFKGKMMISSRDFTLAMFKRIVINFFIMLN